MIEKRLLAFSWMRDFFFRQISSRRGCLNVRPSLFGLVGLFGLAIALLAMLSIVIPPRSLAPPRERITIGPLRPTAWGPHHEQIEVQDGLIQSLGAENQPATASPSAAIIIGEGLFAMPGLTDSHVHLPPAWLPGQIDFFLLMLLSHGVTSVRELGTVGVSIGSLTASITEGSRAGPRIVSCGPPITGDPRFERIMDVAIDAESLVRLLESRSERGGRCAKIYRGFRRELLDKGRRVADREGLELVGHLPRDTPWDQSAIGDVQHLCDPRCHEIRRAAIAELTSAAIERGVRHTPTLATYAAPLGRGRGRAGLNSDGRNRMPRIWTDLIWNPEILARLGVPRFLDERGQRVEAGIAANVANELIEAGAVLHVGTDTPYPFVVPGQSVFEEMRLLHELGLSLPETWKAATSNPGQFWGEESTGEIKVGARADLLLFREDPTLNLEALDSLVYVIADGRLFDVEDLRDRIRRQLKYLDGPVYSMAIQPLARAMVFGWTQPQPLAPGVPGP